MCRGCEEPWDEVTHLSIFKSARTYHCAVVAFQFVKVCRVDLPLFDRSTLFIGVGKDVEVIVIKAVADEDIGNEFQG